MKFPCPSGVLVKLAITLFCMFSAIPSQASNLVLDRSFGWKGAVTCEGWFHSPESIVIDDKLIYVAGSSGAYIDSYIYRIIKKNGQFLLFTDGRSRIKIKGSFGNESTALNLLRVRDQKIFVYGSLESNVASFAFDNFYGNSISSYGNGGMTSVPHIQCCVERYQYIDDLPNGKTIAFRNISQKPAGLQAHIIDNETGQVDTSIPAIRSLPFGRRYAPYFHKDSFDGSYFAINTQYGPDYQRPLSIVVDKFQSTGEADKSFGVSASKKLTLSSKVSSVRNFTLLKETKKDFSIVANFSYEGKEVCTSFIIKIKKFGSNNISPEFKNLKGCKYTRLAQIPGSKFSYYSVFTGGAYYIIKMSSDLQIDRSFANRGYFKVSDNGRNSYYPTAGVIDGNNFYLRGIYLENGFAWQELRRFNMVN